MDEGDLSIRTFRIFAIRPGINVTAVKIINPSVF